MRPSSAFRFIRRFLLCLLLAGCVCVGCSRRVESSNGRLKVTVSIPPQRFFVERIGGERVDVEVMVGPGESPGTYEPKPSQLRALSESAVYFRVGVPFEDAWMRRLREIMVDGETVHVAEGQAELAMATHHGGHDHVHGADPHTWLSPKLALQQAQRISDTLCRLDPASASIYRENLSVLQQEIEVLDRELSEQLSGLPSRQFMVFHPSWGYFARDYGLEQVAIEVGGQEPSAQELANRVSRAREQGIRVVFVQPEFDTSKAETLAASLDGRIVRVSPLAEDWAENLRLMGRSLAEVLGP